MLSCKTERHRNATSLGKDIAVRLSRDGMTAARQKFINLVVDPQSHLCLVKGSTINCAVKVRPLANDDL